MNAALVYDGLFVTLPPSAGTPRDNQFQGTELERLVEVACRECYDSFGKGRSSVALHAHILEVINLSVTEHAVITAQLPSDPDDDTGLMIACLNRKGIYVRPTAEHLEITANFRAILEWDQYTTDDNRNFASYDVGAALWELAQHEAPIIFKERKVGRYQATLKTTDLTDDQAHITLWLYGSRGFTHEQVRHRFAISQRSTRYVDESESPYITHPLIRAYLEDQNIPFSTRQHTQQVMESAEGVDKIAYRTLTDRLEQYCKGKGLDETGARKQARGAARGSLGNALASSMIFTAPVSAWKKVMLPQRKSKFADAEIREIYTPALAALKSSQYGNRFNDFQVVPSSDGIGTVLA